MIALDQQTGSTTPVAAKPPASELLVLVVEDSGIVRERLIRLLSTVPNLRIVAEATTAAEAISKIAECAPDVVTLDLRLEQSSGLEVLRAVEDSVRRPCMAVLTNYGDSQSRRECIALGADFFFDKSLELVNLRSVLTELAASAKAGIRWPGRTV
jgi:DNA-binding NarL/FixJ family response regulator